MKGLENIMNKPVKVSTIEPYTKELKRKEFKGSPYRIFKHPNFSSAYIVSKSGIVLGLCNSRVLKETFMAARYYPEHAYKDFESVLVEFDF